jgi:hypothetical protein
MHIVRPPDFVLKDVEEQWRQYYPTGLLKPLLALLKRRPAAIDIIQYEDMNQKLHSCTGKVLNKWRFGACGLSTLTVGSSESKEDMSITSEKIDVCTFCVDREAMKALIVWHHLLYDDTFISRKPKRFSQGTSYEIVFKPNGKEEFELSTVWIE